MSDDVLIDLGMAADSAASRGMNGTVKACQNATDEIISLRSKLDQETRRADAQEQRGDAYCDKVGDLGAKLEF